MHPLPARFLLGGRGVICVFYLVKIDDYELCTVVQKFEPDHWHRCTRAGKVQNLVRSGKTAWYGLVCI